MGEEMEEQQKCTLPSHRDACFSHRDLWQPCLSCLQKGEAKNRMGKDPRWGLFIAAVTRFLPARQIPKCIRPRIRGKFLLSRANEFDSY